MKSLLGIFFSKPGNVPDNFYRYDALDPDEIRTLLIQPGGPDSSLSGEIERQGLGDPERPYEALSYVWGSPKRDETLQIGAKQVQITRNAKELLCQLRDEHHARRVWIDGICIDQDNLSERSHQVTLMHAIFSGASSVLIWVGESDGDTEAVFSMCKMMSKRYHPQTEDESNDYKETADLDSIARMAEDIGCGRDDIFKLTAFASRPWFRRCWTFQEACLSAESHLLCGNLRLHWRIFVSAALYLISKGMASIFGLSADTMAALANFAAANPAHQRAYLSVILPLTRSLQAANDHDRVFSFLGIADQANLPSIKLSYDLPVSEVYTRTAKAMIVQEQGLSVLSGVHGPDLQNQKLPSWVPDWRLSRPTAYLHGYDWPKPKHLYRINESAPFPNEIPGELGPESHILRLRGAKMDTITKICDAKGILIEIATVRRSNKTRIISTSINDELQLFRDKLDIIPKRLGYRFEAAYKQTGEDIFQALMRTLTADRGGVGKEGSGEWVTRYDIVSGSMWGPVGSRWDYKDDERDMLPEVRILVIAMWTFLRGRRVFRTSRGLFGISGEGTKVGDEVWNIVGGQVPFVLRPKRIHFWEKQDTGALKRLQVVGESYVHGVMSGELWNTECVGGDESDGYVDNANGDRLRGSDLQFQDMELI